MSTADSIANANWLKELFREEVVRSASVVEVRIPRASVLAALDQFPRKDLLEGKMSNACHYDYAVWHTFDWTEIPASAGGHIVLHQLSMSLGRSLL
jgi:hypothetical protein